MFVSRVSHLLRASTPLTALVVTLAACKGSSKSTSESGGSSASAALSAPNADPMVMLCGPEPARTSYQVRDQNRSDYRDIQRPSAPLVPRLSVRVSVPPGLSRDDLQAHVCHALVTSYAKAGVKLGAVEVFAYGSENTSGAFSAAKGVLAPEGDWARADPDVAFDNWKVTFEFADGYFDAKPTTFVVGATVTLFDEAAPTVGLSRDPKTFNDSTIVAKVPSGTKARVVGVQEFPLAGGRTVVRYEVETTAGPKRRGWAQALDVKGE